jgi:hypothetical protein
MVGGDVGIQLEPLDPGLMVSLEYMTGRVIIVVRGIERGW